MLADRPRVDATVEAMERCIRPGMTVLDLGAGTGFFAFEALRLGAGRVYAIDPNPAIFDARANALANGLADRLTCFPDSSFSVTLPEPVDVLVSDMRGTLPLSGNHIPALIDARTRFLAPGAVMMPWRDTLLAAVVHAPLQHRDLLDPWGGRETPFATDAITRSLANTLDSVSLTPESLLTPPEPWVTLDYHAVTTPDVAGRIRFVMPRAGTGHGFALWFQTELVPGVGFSTGPSSPGSAHGTAFFPWPQAVTLAEGDVVEIALRADLIGGDYTWRWDARIADGSDASAVKAQFRQSTFFAGGMSLDVLRRQAPDHIPAVTPELAADRFILDRFGSGDSLARIAEEVGARHPERFGPGRDALAHVVSLSMRYRT